MHTILVSGSLAYDRIATFPDQFKNHFVTDKLHTINVSFVVNTLNDNWGGTAGNIAYNLFLLSEEAAIIASVGNDFAPYRSYLNDKADLSFVTEVPHVKTATCHITTDIGNNQIAAFYPGALSIPFSGEIPSADIAIVAPGNKADMERLPHEYRTKKIPFIFDPGQMIPALSKDDILHGLHGALALTVNDYELGLIENKTGFSEADILQEVEVLIVTLGEKGVRIRTKEKEVIVKACSVTAIDPTGAGDAFRAGFMVGCLKKLPFDVCGQIGSTLASFAVEAQGTQNHSPSVEQLQKRYTSMYGAWPL